MTNTDLRARPFAQESGQILVMTAVTMVALLGIAALSLDVSFMYDKRNRLHAAADAAAKSAAIEVFRNPGALPSDLQAFANEQVVANRFDPAGTTIVTVRKCSDVGATCSGAFAGDANYVEAIVSEPTSTFFARILGRSSMTPGATAVAGSGNPSNCLITLGPPGSTPTSLDIGNMKITLTGCGVAVGGDLDGSNPNAEIKAPPGAPAPAVAVTGVWNHVGSMGAWREGAPTPTDPLSGLAAPPLSGVGCPAGTPGTGLGPTLSPGCYTSIPKTVTTLAAGNYYVTGKVDIDKLSGTNVMIYLTGAGNLDGGLSGTLTLTAPISGPYKGIAIFQDKTDINPFDAKNGFTLKVSGAMYFPAVDLSFKNGLDIAQTNCTVLIAKSLYIKNGNGQVTNSGCGATYGGAVFLTVTIAQ